MVNTLRRNLTKLTAHILVLILTFTSVAVPVRARPLDATNNRFSIYSNDPVIHVGDGISVLSGDFLRRYVDLELMSFNPLRFVRAYNSANVNDSAMGVGWRNNFMISANINETLARSR